MQGDLNNQVFTIENWSLYTYVKNVPFSINPEIGSHII